MQVQAFKINTTSLLWTAAGFIAAYAVHFIAKAAGVPNFDRIAIFCLCGCLFYYASVNQKSETIINNVMIGVAVFLSASFLYNLAYSYLAIPEWDFLCFYLFGKTGISHNDFYDPAVFHQQFEALQLQARTSNDFMEEIVKVGFWYPPPSMFLFLILGVFDLQTGYYIWQTLIILFLAVDIILLIRFYMTRVNPDAKQIKNYVLPLLLVLVFPDLTASIYYSQTISLFLFLLLLLIYYINSWKAGIFIALLVVIKPLAVFFGLYFLIYKKWKAVAAAAVTGISIVLVTVLVFGLQHFMNYFTSPPTNRIPDFIYLEYSSLFGVLKRLQQQIPAYINPGNVKIIYYSLSAVVMGITLLSLRKLSRVSALLPFLVFIPLALLIYPATLFHYNILLLPVILFLFAQQLFSSTVLNLSLLLVLYLVGMYNFFFFNVMLWGILIGWPFLLKQFKNTGHFKTVPV